MFFFILWLKVEKQLFFTIYNIIKTIPQESQICLFSATIPQDIIELSNNFMNNPEQLLVKKEALTLEGITQFYINLKFIKV